MNTYYKLVPNVHLAKCSEVHEKGDVIQVETRYKKEIDCVVFNLVLEKDGFYFYSIIRADGFNNQTRSATKAEKITGWAATAEKKFNQFYEASQEGRDFLSLGEPIKVGHHSEGRHRALIERNNNRMKKAIEAKEQAEKYIQKAEFWTDKTTEINLSMPESIEHFRSMLEMAKIRHSNIRTGVAKREHGYSLSYAKKEVNELENKYKLALKLWS